MCSRDFFEKIKHMAGGDNYVNAQVVSGPAEWQHFFLSKPKGGIQSRIKTK